MHILQPKHSKLNEKESKELLEKLNVSKAQLPKILLSDPSLPENCVVGDIIKISRKESESKILNRLPKTSNEGDKINIYFRVVV